MNNRISRRLTLYFALVLLLFALIAGALFSMMFARHTVDVMARDLSAHTAEIAETLTHFMLNYVEGDCQGRGFKSYTRFVGDLSMSDLYVLDAQGQSIALGEMELTDNDPPEHAQILARRIFDGGELVCESFSGGVFHVGSLMAAAPVFAADGRILYALVLHYPVNIMHHALRDTVYILGACLAIAMVLAVAVSNLLSRRFVMPLHRMMTATTRLTRGEYSAKTGVAQQDEIGVLAEHIDSLSLKLEKAEQERKELEDMRQNFFSDISHELRTPISVFKGNVELLSSGMIADEAQRQEMLCQLYADATHMQHLVNDLLELTRLQSPHFAIEMEVINLTDVLFDTVRSMRRRAEEKRVTIALQDETGPFPTLGDYARLRQLMVILLDNAIKFSPEGAQVVIRAEIVSGGCEVTVSDSGPGMDEDALAHMFDRFYHSRESGSKGGTGLGLPIAREIAQRHQLALICHSEAGRGTRFTLTFARHALEDMETGMRPAMSKSE